MDIFNTKKIEELKKTVDKLVGRVYDIEKDNKALKKIAFEQFSKNNKPKFKIGDKVEYRFPAFGSYISYKGIVFNVNVCFNVSGGLMFIYDISVNGEAKVAIEPFYLTKLK